MSDGLVPLNLSARLEQSGTGNPATAGLADGVANCFPGLEFDHRNLDRRFFPGLVVEFADQPGTQSSLGGVVVSVDLDDPVLADQADGHPGLAADLTALAARMAADERAWWIVRIVQAGVVIDPRAIRGVGLGLLGTWRIVRSLDPGPVQVVLDRFDRDGAAAGDEITLEATRRPYLAAGGTIDAGFAAGELTQSLCSPWQHDFRDCGCFYWASNHPDLVIEAIGPDEDPEVPPAPGTGLLNWQRARPPRPAVPELAYYEISQRYQDLDVVLRDRESRAPYRSRVLEEATPFTPDELVAELRDGLAPLEHALTLEYLYAWSSVRAPEEVTALPEADLAAVLPVRFRADPARPLDGISDRTAAIAYLRSRLVRDVIFLREQLRATAISEMRHLGWVNLLLRQLAEMGIGAPYRPALGIARDIPSGTQGATRPAALRPLRHDAVVDFEEVERPSGGLDGRYARIRATLVQPEYPDELSDIASRIVDDGVDHYSAFRRMVMIVDLYDQPSPPHLRPGFALAPPGEPAVASALQAQGRIMTLLSQGFAGDQLKIAEARAVMLDQLEVAIDRSARNGFGVPFFEF